MDSRLYLALDRTNSVGSRRVIQIGHWRNDKNEHALALHERERMIPAMHSRSRQTSSQYQVDAALAPS